MRKQHQLLWAASRRLQQLQTRCISSRVQGIGNNVFAEISGLAAQHGAVNLGQGFPSFATPECVLDTGSDSVFLILCSCCVVCGPVSCVAL